MPELEFLLNLLTALLGDEVRGLHFECKSPRRPSTIPSLPAGLGFDGWTVSLDNPVVPTMPLDLRSALEASDKKASLFVGGLQVLPSRRAFETSHESDLQGPVGLLGHVLTQVPVGTLVATLVSQSALTSEEGAEARAHLERTHGVRWLVYGPESMRETAGRYPVLVVCEAGTGPSPCTRLLDLRRSPGRTVRRVVHEALALEDGEASGMLALRNLSFGLSPWTFEAKTRRLRTLRQEAEALGQVRRLGELCDVQRGLNLPEERGLLERLPEGAELPEDYHHVITIGALEPDQGFGFPAGFSAPCLEAIPEKYSVEAGDLVVSGVFDRRRNEEGPMVTGRRVPNGLVAVLGPNVLRLRWKEHVPEEAQRFLSNWLRSEHGALELRAHGAAGFLSPGMLEGLSVPFPSASA